jgi:pyrimidine-specific ribonucleoside hydrolase
MRKRITGTLFLIMILCGHLFAHSGKPKYHVIIDTDGTLEDMRALNMLLSGNDIRVLAITCSQGMLPADSVFVKVRNMLSALHHEGIPVGISRSPETDNPSEASTVKDALWQNPGDHDGLYFTGEATAILNHTTEDYPERITLIALGSLKTYADWLKKYPGIREKIDRILWYNNHNFTGGVNYRLSPGSYEYIRNTGIITELITGKKDAFPVDQDYFDVIRNAGSVYADQITALHSRRPATDKPDREQQFLSKDMLPLYLTVPVLFDVKKNEDVKYVSINPLIPPAYIHEIIGKLLISATTTNNRVFNSFPVETNLYKPEYAGMMNETIKKFGLAEWKAVSLTNEIHGHTGIYSILGAKMGIRAMDFFNVGVNNLEVTTFAGNDPPLSCFNDGIQISTGATIGQGLITISDSISAVPSAIFEFNGRKVRMAAKPEIAEQMQRDIKYGVETFGALTDPYWLYIEDLAIKYWAEFDRHEIFFIEWK